jgi:hypothetical protein
MSNLYNELVYVSLQDARDTSDVFWATVPVDADLTTLITKAQWIIDNYIGWYWIPFVDTQTFIFPVNMDDVSTIPTDIKLATIQIAEYLYLSWSTTLSQLSPVQVKSESNLWRSVTFDNQSTIDTIQIPQKTLSILNKYKWNTFIWQVI